MKMFSIALVVLAVITAFFSAMTVVDGFMNHEPDLAPAIVLMCSFLVAFLASGKLDELEKKSKLKYVNLDGVFVQVKVIATYKDAAFVVAMVHDKEKGDAIIMPKDRLESNNEDS